MNEKELKRMQIRDFCEGFLCDFDFNEVVKTNTPQDLAESYVNLYVDEIYQQYVNWHKEKFR